MLTLGQAAKEVGKTKTTLANAIKNGRLSAIRDDKGFYKIDPPELFRVYPVERLKITESVRDKTIDLQLEVGLLHQQVEHLKAQISREAESVRDLRLDRDNWREQAETMRLIAHQPVSRTIRPVFWAALFGVVLSMFFLMGVRYYFGV